MIQDNSGQQQAQYRYLLSSSYFLLLLDNLNRIELRYLKVNSGEAIIRVMGSRDVAINQWNKLIITDNASRNRKDNFRRIINNSKQDDMDEIILVLPEPIAISSQRDNERNTSQACGELFVAGRPNQMGDRYDNNNKNNDNNDENLRANNNAQYKILSNDNNEIVIDNSDQLIVNDEREITGFSGCIQNVTINERKYVMNSNLNGDILDGFDISEYEHYS